MRAAIGESSDSIQAWRTWSSSHAVADLCVGGVRLLPLIHYNLQQHGLEDGAGPGANDDLVRMWCETELQFHEAAELLCALERAGVETMVLKGAALGFLDYPDPSLRPMSDIDVLVRPGDLAAGLEVLQQSGWTSTEGRPEDLFPFQHAVSFSNGRGGSVDLHSRVLWQGKCLADDDRGFWARSVPLTVDGVSTRAMAPEDRLFHACIHGLEWSYLLPVRWIADAAMIIRSHGETLAWNHLADEALARHLALPIRDALLCIQETAGVNLPARALAPLESVRTSRYARLAHRVRSGREGTYLSQLNDWAIGWRQTDKPLHRKTARFLTCIATSRGLGHPWQAPFSLGWSAIRLSGRLLRDG